jgi:hypothetical protein
MNNYKLMILHDKSAFLKAYSIYVYSIPTFAKTLKQNKLISKVLVCFQCYLYTYLK